MAERILVAYATRYGSTIEVAEAIGDELRKTGAEVDVLPVGEVPDLSPYQAAVIGSPIYMGKWLPDAQIFIEQHQHHLRAIPVAYFAIGITVAEGGPDDLKRAEASMDQVRMLVPPVAIGIFSGRLESGLLSLPDHTIFKLIQTKEGDFRDLDGVRAWAQTIHPNLTRTT